MRLRTFRHYYDDMGVPWLMLLTSDWNDICPRGTGQPLVTVSIEGTSSRSVQRDGIGTGEPRG